MYFMCLVEAFPSKQFSFDFRASRSRQSLARYSIVQSVAALILNGLLVYLNIGEKIKRGSEAQPFVNGTNGTEAGWV